MTTAAIDYAERVEDVLLTLNGEFGVADREAVELLLASRLDCDLPYPWMVLETSYLSLDTSGAWFECLAPGSLMLTVLRLMRPRSANYRVEEILRARREGPKLFIEPQGERVIKVHSNVRLWPYLMAECLRLRVKHPKRALTGVREEQQLQAAVARVLDMRWRETTGLKLPTHPSLPYYAEVLQRITPWVPNWEALLTNLVALTARRALLFDRRVDSTDWRAVCRVMRDTIPSWTIELLEGMGEDGRLARNRCGIHCTKETTATLDYLYHRGVASFRAGVWRMKDDPAIEDGVTDLLKGDFLSV